MNNWQERFDDLDNIVRTLDVLIDEVKDKYYFDALNEIRCEAQNDLEKAEEELTKEQEEENDEQEKQYWKSQF